MKCFALFPMLPVIAAAMLSPFTSDTNAQEADAGSPRSLTVRVMDQTRQTPIGGAEVFIEGDELAEAKQLADAQGVAALSIGPATRGYYVITVKAENYTPLRFMMNASSGKLDVPNEISFPMSEGKTVGGIVVDSDGQPVEGASVVISMGAENLPAGISSAISYTKLKTDAQGKWSYPLAPAQPGRVSVGAYHVAKGGNAQGFFPMNTLEEQADRDALYVGTYRVALPAAQVVRGTVTDTSGAPIEGARVQLGDDSVASNSLPTAKTDAQGHYEIGVLRDAEVSLTFKAPKHAPDVVRITASENLGATDVKLTPAQTLRGKVVDQGGNPVKGATVFIDTWRGKRTLNEQLKVNENGEFVWEDAPPDEVLINVLAVGYAANRTARITAGQANVVTLSKPVKFAGTVIDAQTKKPVTGFRVREGYANGNTTQFYSDMERIKLDPAKPGTFELTLEELRDDVVYGIVASGYAPAQSPMLKLSEGDQLFTYELTPAADLTGKVVDPYGKPASGVKLYLVAAGRNLQVENGRVAEHYAREVETAKTDDVGAFFFTANQGKFEIIAISDSGFGRMSSDAFNAGTLIALEPWARITGVVKSGSKLMPRTKIGGQAQGNFEQGAPFVSISFDATSDAEGRFVIERASPGKYIIGKDWRTGSGHSYMQTIVAAVPVTIAPDQTTEVTVGGGGRKVKGRVQLPEESKGAKISTVDLNTKIVMPPMPQPPKPVPSMTGEERKAFAESDEVKAFMKAQEKAYTNQFRTMSAVSSDGTFEFDDVPPGDYTLSGQYSVQTNSNPWGEVRGRVSESVKVEAGDFDQPVELPPAAIVMKTNLDPGAIAPAFDVESLDGKSRVKLADHKGKIVLLDFWATWCGPCVAEMPHLKRVHEKFGNDPRFVLISLSLDNTKEPLKAFIEQEKMTWTQGYLGPWAESKVPASYGVEGIPAIFLLDGEGKVIAKDLRGEAIDVAIEKALAALRK